MLYVMPMTANPTETAAERAVARLLTDAARLAKARGVSISTISRAIFGDARVLESLHGGSRAVSVGRLQRASRRLQHLMEKK